MNRPCVVGAEPGWCTARDPCSWPAAMATDGVRDRLAGVGGEDAALDDRRRLERQGDLLVRPRSSAGSRKLLPGEAEVADAERDVDSRGRCRRA